MLVTGLGIRIWMWIGPLFYIHIWIRYKRDGLYLFLKVFRILLYAELDPAQCGSGYMLFGTKNISIVKKFIVIMLWASQRNL